MVLISTEPTVAQEGRATVELFGHRDLELHAANPRDGKARDVLARVRRGRCSRVGCGGPTRRLLSLIYRPALRAHGLTPIPSGLRVAPGHEDNSMQRNLYAITW